MDGRQPFNPFESNSWSVAEDQSKKIEELKAAAPSLSIELKFFGVRP